MNALPSSNEIALSVSEEVELKLSKIQQARSLMDLVLHLYKVDNVFNLIEEEGVFRKVQVLSYNLVARHQNACVGEVATEVVNVLLYGVLPW